MSIACDAFSQNSRPSEPTVRVAARLLCRRDPGGFAVAPLGSQSHHCVVASVRLWVHYNAAQGPVAAPEADSIVPNLADLIAPAPEGDLYRAAAVAAHPDGDVGMGQVPRCTTCVTCAWRGRLLSRRFCAHIVKRAPTQTRILPEMWHMCQDLSADPPAEAKAEDLEETCGDVGENHLRLVLLVPLCTYVAGTEDGAAPGEDHKEGEEDREENAFLSVPAIPPHLPHMVAESPQTQS